MKKKYTKRKSIRKSSKRKTKRTYKKVKNKNTRKKRGGNKWFKRFMNPEKLNKQKVQELMDDWIIAVKNYEIKKQLSLEKSIRKILSSIKDIKYKHRVDTLIQDSNRCARLSEIDKIIEDENKKASDFRKRFFEELIFISIPKIYIDYKEKTKDKPLGTIDSFKFLKKSYDDITNASDISYASSQKDYMKRLTETISFLEKEYEGNPQRKSELLKNVKKRKEQLENENLGTQKKYVKKGQKSGIQHELEKYEDDYKKNILIIDKFCKEESSNTDTGVLEIKSEIDKLGGCKDINKIYSCFSVVFFGKSRKRLSKPDTYSLNDWLLESQNTINSWFKHLNETSTKGTCSTEINLLQKIINDISIEKQISKEQVQQDLNDSEKNVELSTLLVDKYKRDLQKINEITGDIIKYNKNKPKKGLFERLKKDKSETTKTKSPPKEDTPEDVTEEVTGVTEDTSEEVSHDLEVTESQDEGPTSSEEIMTKETETSQTNELPPKAKEWIVLTTSSVRQGLEKISNKIKDYKKGEKIKQIGETETDSEGREKIKTVDGYVSIMTSKGKKQLEEIK